MKIKRILFYLREFFFPAGCALCGVTLTSMDETWYGLCGSCRNDMLLCGGEEESCDLCGRPLISEKGRCLSCRNGEDRHFDRVITLYPYTGKYRKLLAAYKFNKNLAVGCFLAERIRESVRRLNITEDFVMVPVPPRPGKIRKTGWDQIEYLAKLLARGQAKEGKKFYVAVNNFRSKKHIATSAENIRVSRCLKRLPSISQKKLNREDRRKNLKGRILLTRTPPKTAIVFDDVITTGSTLDACAAVLKAGGAEKVYGICLFYD
ncbi:MAG: double zinc ribbon domain-containing protein [Treponema sp.]|jgi:ComF family protein|nr:double zinc ribbon domain-containing protein [Treponema sp.]